MIKRTFSIVIAFGITIIVMTTALMSSVFYNYFETQVETELKSVSAVLQSQIENGYDADFINASNYSDIRITLIDSNGTVLADNKEDFSSLDNHGGRTEIEEAKKSGQAFSVRESDTLGEKAYYYATVLENGEILRVSVEVRSVWSILSDVGPYILMVVAVVIVFAVAVSVGITKKIIKPVEKLSRHLDNPDEVKAYPELQPFVNALKEQKEKQKALDKQKKQFTANVSHELKTPLTSIAGYAELIETGIAQEADVKPFAGIIRKQALRLVSLSEDIIQLSQLDESDRESVTFSSVDLYDTANKCVEALSINARLKNITISLNGESTFVRANAPLLEELVYNLCDNAIRYNKENGRVDVKIEKLEKGAVLTVKDTGIGIEDKYKDRVFERFFRVDKSRSKATGGTGLGLAIVKHIAEIHGADIKVDSVLGEGTAISVTFLK